MSAKGSKKRGFWPSFGGGSGKGKKRGKRSSQSVTERPWVVPTLATGAAISGFAAIAGSVFWLMQSGIVDRAATALEQETIEAMRTAGLAVEEVYVSGRRQTDRDELLAAIGVSLGDPILPLDTETIRDRVEEIGWVRKARIERRLPNTLVVRIAERKAAAIWQQDGEFVLIDAEGVVIGPEDVSSHQNLKVVVGEKAPQKAAHLLSVMEGEPALKARVVAAVWISGRRWNIRLDNGVDIRLPEKDPESAWQRLARLQRDHDILARAVQTIDLRQPDRLIVRMTRDGAMKIRARAEGEET